MELWKVCLGMVGAVVALFGVCWLCLLLERKFPVRKFDERQQDARAKAYRFGFWIGIVYFFTIWFLLSRDLVVDHVAELVVGGILLQALGGHFYMFLTGSDLPFAQKPTLMFIAYYALGFLWLYSAYRNVFIEQKLAGTSTVPWFDLMASVSWLTLGVLYFISWLKGQCDE